MQPSSDRSPQPPPVPPVTYAPQTHVQPIVRWKNRLVIDRYGPALPADRCYKCNAPATSMKSKVLTWSHPALLLLIFLGVLIFLIVALILQKKVTVVFGLCDRCRQKRTIWILVSTLIVFGTLTLAVFGAMEENWALFFGSLVGLIVALGVLVVAPRIGYAVKIDDRWIHLRGAGRDFRETFPEITYDQR